MKIKVMKNKCQWCNDAMVFIKTAPFDYKVRCSNFNCITNILIRQKEWQKVIMA